MNRSVEQIKNDLIKRIDVLLKQGKLNDEFKDDNGNKFIVKNGKEYLDKMYENYKKTFENVIGDEGILNIIDRTIQNIERKKSVPVEEGLIVKKIGELQNKDKHVEFIGKIMGVSGRIIDVKQNGKKMKRKIHSMIVGDETGRIICQLWTNVGTINNITKYFNEENIGKTLHIVNASVSMNKYSKTNGLIVNINQKTTIEESEDNINVEIKDTIADTDGVVSLKCRLYITSETQVYERKDGSGDFKVRKFIVQTKSGDYPFELYNDDIDKIDDSYDKKVVILHNIYCTKNPFAQSKYPYVIRPTEFFTIEMIEGEDFEYEIKDIARIPKNTGTSTVGFTNTKIIDLELNKPSNVTGYILKFESQRYVDNAFVDKKPYYHACGIVESDRTCRRKVIENSDGTYECPTHGKLDPNQIEKRVILSMTFSDGTGEIKTTVFYDAIKDLINLGSEKDIINLYESKLISHQAFIEKLNAFVSGRIFNFFGKYVSTPFGVQFRLYSINEVPIETILKTA